MRGPTSNATSSACRCVPVFTNTDFSWVRAVETLTPRAAATTANVSPPAMPKAIWASAGVKQNREHRDASETHLVLRLLLGLWTMSMPLPGGADASAASHPLATPKWGTKAHKIP